MKKPEANLWIGNTRFWHVFLLFAVAVYLIYPLLGEGYFVGQEALGPQYRVYGIGLAISSGQFPPKVLPNLVNGLGYGWNIFYSPLAYDFTWVISALGFSYITSTKLIHFLAILLSGTFIYALVIRITGRGTAALIAAVLYMTAPYRLVDLYVRNAYAESFAFLFVPVVFLGMYEIFHGDPRRWWVLAAGMSGIVLTHNISGLYCALFVAAYVATQARRLAKEINLLRSLGVAALMSVLLTAYFIGPLLEHQAAHSYAVFDPEFVRALGFSADHLRDHAVKPWQLFSHEFMHLSSVRPQSLPLASDKPEMPFLLGVPLVLFAAVGVFAARRHAAQNIFRFSMIAALLSLVMTLEGFPWEFVPQPLHYLQFPWRLLLFAVFFLSLTGGAAGLLIPEKYDRNFVIVPLVVLLCVYVFGFIKPDYRAFLNDSVIPAIENVRNPNSNIGTSKAEYLPIRSIEHLNYLREHRGAPVILSGEADFISTEHFGTNLSINVVLNTSEALIELPFVYYLGYQATLQTHDDIKHDLDIFEGPNGLGALIVHDSGKVSVRYGVTQWSAVSYAMTFAGLIWLALLLIFRNQFVMKYVTRFLRRAPLHGN